MTKTDTRPAEEVSAGDGGQQLKNDDTDPAANEHAIIITVNNRFKRRTGKEVVVHEENKIGEVHKFATQPAIVRRGYGVTLNQGDFNSARIDVTIEVPCYVEDIELADEWAQRFVEQRLTEEVASLGSSGGNTSFSKKRERSPI